LKSRKSWALAGVIVALFFLTAPAFGAGDEPPASVLIDSLSHLYGGVVFDHEQHVDITGGDCSVCHHHVFGTGTKDPQCARCHSDSKGVSSVACRDCHVRKPFATKHIKKIEANPDRYHIDVPGLKGAYHLSCFNCHVKMGAPTGCQDCHKRTDAGNRFYHSGKYAPTGSGVRGQNK